jgi:alcohol dehydrogenase
MPMTDARALVLTAPRTLELRSMPVPEPGEGGVLRVEACGLCGTDHEQYTGQLFPGFAFVPGHEVVGVIEAASERALDRWGVDLGQRVAVEVFLSCRECDACLAGEYRRCPRHGLADMIGFLPVDRSPGLWGGYATHLYLQPDALLLPVPDGVDPVLATAFNPLGAGIRWGATVPGTADGAVVAVLGPGMRGISAVVAAREAGADFVMVTGHGERDADRLAWARRFGADLTVDVAVDDPAAALREATGGLADIVVDVTAKAPAAFAQGVGLARPGGTMVVAGTRGTADTPGFSPDHIVYKELHVIGALGVDAPAYREALAILAAGRYPFAEVSRRTAGLDDLEPLLATLAGETGGVPPLHGVLVP